MDGFLLTLTLQNFNILSPFSRILNCQPMQKRAVPGNRAMLTSVNNPIPVAIIARYQYMMTDHIWNNRWYDVKNMTILTFGIISTQNINYKYGQ